MKMENLLSRAGLFFMVTMCFCLSILTANTLSFEEFLQGVDFEKLTKDIEKAMEKAEQNNEAPLPQIPVGPTSPQPGVPIQVPTTLAPTQPQESSSPTKNIETIFLEPIKPTLEKGRPTHIKVSDEKKKAYDHFMGNMVEQLSELERIIENSPKISSTFKAFFTEFQEAIDEITVQNDSIRSKKNIYLAKLYEDKEGPNELRKKIVLTSKQLNGFYQKLKISEEVELKAEETDEQELTAFANKKFEAPKPYQVIERKQRGRRGAPDPMTPVKEGADEEKNKNVESNQNIETNKNIEGDRNIESNKNIEKDKNIEKETQELPVSPSNNKERP